MTPLFLKTNLKTNFHWNFYYIWKRNKIIIKLMYDLKATLNNKKQKYLNLGQFTNSKIFSRENYICILAIFAENNVDTVFVFLPPSFDRLFSIGQPDIIRLPISPEKIIPKGWNSQRPERAFAHMKRKRVPAEKRRRLSKLILFFSER